MPPQHPPPTLGVWLDPAMGKGPPRQQAGNKKAGGGTGPDQQSDPLAVLSSALDRVRLSFPEEEVRDLLASSSALIEKEKKKKVEQMPEWCRLRDLQTKLGKKKKAEQSSKALAEEFKKKSEAALQESQFNIAKAAEAAKSIKELEKEIAALGPGGDDPEAKVHPWLPNRLRKALPKVQDSEEFKKQLDLLAQAQQAMEKLVKEATPVPEPAEDDSAGADRKPGEEEEGKAAEADMCVDEGNLTEEEKKDLVDKMVAAMGLSEADDEARKRASEILEKDGFTIVKRQKRG